MSRRGFIQNSRNFAPKRLTDEQDFSSTTVGKNNFTGLAATMTGRQKIEAIAFRAV
jgi:hypothetical protein